MSKVLNKYVISEPFASVTLLQAFNTAGGDGVDAGVLANVIVDNASATVSTLNLYAFSALCTTTANANTIVIPDNITHPAAGRWLKITDRQIAGIIANNVHGYFATATGAADVYTADVPGTVGSYAVGLRLWVIIDTGMTNTGASTINVDTIGAKNIKLQDGNDPAAGDMVAAKISHLVYDGTNFQLLNPLVTDAAPTDATYLVQTASAGLSSEQAMGALASGITFNTTTSGVQSIATDHSDFSLSNSGVLTGFNLTINGGDNTTFDLAAGSGFIIDDTNPSAPVKTKITYAGSTANAVTAIATHLITHLLLVNDGTTILQRTTAPTPTQMRTHIYLGLVGHATKTILLSAIDQPSLSYDENNLAVDLYQALGSLNKSGHVISANGANLKFDRSAGTSLMYGRNAVTSKLTPNITTDAADTDVTFIYLYQDAGSDWTAVAAQTALVPGNYDDGDGTLGSVGNNQWTNQRHYLIPYPASTDVSVVYYGQNIYSTQDEALVALNNESFTEASATLTGAIFVGWITMKGNVSNLSNTNQATFTNAGTFRSSGAGGASTGSSTNALTAKKVIVPCLKSTAGTITKGQAVYLVGFDATNTVPTIELAQADSSSTMPAFGIADASITDSSQGNIVILGNVTGIDTSSFSSGDVLYVDAAIAGTLVAAKPVGTNLIQNIGDVTFSDASDGEIEVFGSGRANDLPNIASTKMWIGDTNGVPQEFTSSGDLTNTAGGAFTIANDAVTLAKMAGGTDGNLITYDTSGDPAFVATGSAGQMLQSKGAGAVPVFANVIYDIPFNAGFNAVSVKENVVVQTYAEMCVSRAGSFSGESGYADTAPTGATLILDIEKNGTTIYATKPLFAIGANTLTAGVLKTDGAEDFVAADRITFKCTQIGSTEAGEGIRFTVKAEAV